jgi:hypothetical protein
MKDWHMLIVVLIVMLTPFLPLILKGKCPKCGKRKLETSEENTNASPNPFIAYLSCTACNAKFLREKSGPLQPLPDDQPAESIQV